MSTTGTGARRVAVVSDIHGNLTALDAVIADIDRRGVDGVVHGGDHPDAERIAATRRRGRFVALS
jgi:predicted phosphodiesterase